MKDTDHSSSSGTALNQYQKDLFRKYMAVDIESGGFKPGEVAVMMSSRRAGKSQLVEYYHNWKAIFEDAVMPAFHRVTGAIVDGEQWYTVQCRKDVSKWVRTLDEKHWQEHIDQRGYMDFNIFDMHEKLYTMLAVKWS